MSSEHNPVAELIHQIQKKWTDEISPFPEIRLARWLIKPEQARLFEGFLKLESTEHGAIPEILVAMLTPFKDESSYALQLIQDWNKAFAADKKARETLAAAGKKSWDPEVFLSGRPGPDGTHDLQLLKMFAAFRQEMMEAGTGLVVALFPHSIQNMDAFTWWLTELLKKPVPPGICIMIFDHIGEYYFDRLFQQYPDITKSLHIDLDLEGAVSKIAKMGDPNSPEVQLRECILEMGRALQLNNQARLHHWGEKALKVTQQSGLKSMYASAHLVYAGMLFSLKQFEKIDGLLENGLTIAKKGLAAEAAACKPLLIQFYGYTAASKQLQKKIKEAITAFETQGNLAIAYQLPAMALMPLRQAYMLSRKEIPQRYEELLQHAFATGRALQKEEQANSCFPSIALDFMQLNQHLQQWEVVKQTDDECQAIFGTDWKEKAKNPNAFYSKNTKEAAIIN